MNSRVKLMVATEIASDAELVRSLLQNEFDERLKHVDALA
jgi:hypothetical protein